MKDSEKMIENCAKEMILVFAKKMSDYASSIRFLADVAKHPDYYTGSIDLIADYCDHIEGQCASIETLFDRK